MSAYVNITTFALSIDAAGNSESRPLPFSYANDPVITGGDSLASSPVPTPTVAKPNGTASLTIGTPTLSGTTWTAEVSITGGVPGNVYEVCCLAHTTQSNILMAQVNVILTGPG